MQMSTPEVLQYVRENCKPYLVHSEFNKNPVHRIRLACIVQMLDRTISGGRGRIFEIGCSMGNIAIPLAGLGYHVTACDIQGEQGCPQEFLELIRRLAKRKRELKGA